MTVRGNVDTNCHCSRRKRAKPLRVIWELSFVEVHFYPMDTVFRRSYRLDDFEILGQQ